jgi:hypothetical protein
MTCKSPVNSASSCIQLTAVTCILLSHHKKIPENLTGDIMIYSCQIDMVYFGLLKT